MRFMGIDFGSKKIGVALTDEEQTMAFPHEVILNDDTLIERVTSLIAAKNVSAVVMGESKDYQGRPNPIAQQAERFAEILRERTGVPVYFEPEMLTTKEAERLQGPSPLTDASAAAIILQSYLDKQPKSHGDQ
jgi:putative holliday junction resolvase